MNIPKELLNNSPEELFDCIAKSLCTYNYVPLLKEITDAELVEAFQSEKTFFELLENRKDDLIYTHFKRHLLKGDK